MAEQDHQDIVDTLRADGTLTHYMQWRQALERAAQEIEGLRDCLEDANQQLQQVQDERDNLRLQLDGDAADKAEERAAKAQAERYEADLRVKRDECQDLRDQIERLRDYLDDASRRLQDIKAERDNLRLQLDGVVKERDAALRERDAGMEVAGIEAREAAEKADAAYYGACARAMEAQRERDLLKRNLDQTREECDRAIKRATKAEAERDQLRRQAEQASADRDDLRRELSKMNRKEQAAKHALANADQVDDDVVVRRIAELDEQGLRGAAALLRQLIDAGDKLAMTRPGQDAFVLDWNDAELGVKCIVLAPTDDDERERQHQAKEESKHAEASNTDEVWDLARVRQQAVTARGHVDAAIASSLEGARILDHQRGDA